MLWWPSFPPAAPRWSIVRELLFWNYFSFLTFWVALFKGCGMNYCSLVIYFDSFAASFFIDFLVVFLVF